MSVQRILQKCKSKAYKCVSTTHMNDSYCQRTERSGQLLQGFNDRSLPRLAFQDEKDFTVQGKTYHQSNHVYSKGRLFNGDYSVEETSFP